MRSSIRLASVFGFLGSKIRKSLFCFSVRRTRPMKRSLEIQTRVFETSAKSARTFSLLISTRARSPTALAILLARVLNAPHCLQASTTTTFLDDPVDLDTGAFFEAAAAAGDFFFLALVAAAFLGGAFLVVAVFGASSVGGSAPTVLLESRVDRRVGAIVKESILGRILIDQTPGFVRSQMTGTFDTLFHLQKKLML